MHTQAAVLMGVNWIINMGYMQYILLGINSHSQATLD